MVDAAPAAYSWSGVSGFEFTRLVRHGRTRGRLSLDEVGKHFEVSRERIRQIEARTIAKLRHPIRADPLRSYLEGD